MFNIYIYIYTRSSVGGRAEADPRVPPICVLYARVPPIHLYIYMYMYNVYVYVQYHQAAAGRFARRRARRGTDGLE